MTITTGDRFRCAANTYAPNHEGKEIVVERAGVNVHLGHTDDGKAFRWAPPTAKRDTIYRDADAWEYRITVRGEAHRVRWERVV